MVNNSNSSVHSVWESDEIWDGNYDGPLQRAEKQYKLAQILLYQHYVVVKSYANSLFNEAYETTETPVEYATRLKLDFVKKAMTYASALFSAVNSPSYRLLPYKMKKLFLALREVVSEIEKHGVTFLNAIEKEVVLACVIELGKKASGFHRNKEYYNSLAGKLTQEILDDKHAPLSTIMLTLARIASFDGPPHEKKDRCKEKVLRFLEKIHSNPSKIEKLDQDWKTYVRLARMIFAWKYMFFGLRHDSSRDLRIKSYAYYIRYFYR